ncbi:MAG: hypothetical protein P8174_07310, partial [Gemmatimonadota bacterium]
MADTVVAPDREMPTVRVGGPEPSVPRGRERPRRDWRRAAWILLGLALFAAAYLAPLPGPAVDPQGKAFALTPEGKAALGLFLFAAVWWITEVIPIGVTSIAIGVLQGLLLIRPARTAFTDFMDPSVWFIF